MKLLRSSLLAAVMIVIVGLFAHVSASESITEMRSVTQYDYRCWAGTVRMKDGAYKINVSCRNLIYPNVNGPTTVAYVLWANATDGSGTFRLGTLDFGTRTFSTKTPFGSMFVTTEETTGPREPSANIAMSGDSRPILFLDSPQAVDEISADALEDDEITFEDEGPMRPSEELDRATSADEDSAASGGSTLKRTSLIASIVILVILIAFIFIITKSRS